MLVIENTGHYFVVHLLCTHKFSTLQHFRPLMCCCVRAKVHIEGIAAVASWRYGFRVAGNTASRAASQ